MSQKITSDITDESNTVFNNCVVLPVQEVKVFCLHLFLLCKICNLLCLCTNWYPGIMLFAIWLSIRACIPSASVNISLTTWGSTKFTIFGTLPDKHE